MTIASAPPAAGSAGPTGKRYTAPDFSVANLLLQRETQLSSVFAHLLDPNETHEQGETFLDRLLDELVERAGPKVAAFRTPAGSDSRVLLERGTPWGRPDIRVELEDGRRLAIENKPWAWEQPKQIERYLRFLDPGDSPTDKVVLLYWIGWSGKGSDPDLSGLPARLKDRYVKMPYWKTTGYPSVEGWLRRCAKACQAPPVTSFLEDLINYVVRWFPDVTHRLEEEVARLERDPWKLERNPKGWLFRPPCWGAGDWSGVWIYRSNQNRPRLEVGASGWPHDADLKNALLDEGVKVVGDSSSGAWRASDHNNEPSSMRHVSWTFDEKVFQEGKPAEGIKAIRKMAKALMNTVHPG